jgi:formylglycine-generating enzyme required for sulfatase activity
LTLAALVVALAAATAPAWGQNNPPVVSNVIASQRTDGSKLVDVYYDLADADAEACTITVKASSDAGASWTLSITALSGDVGPGIMPGNGKHIVWNCVVDLPGAFGSQYKVRVCADDHITPPGMVAVPAGEFQMGDPWSEGDADERPVHTVYLSQYCIDTYEVTNAFYCQFLNAGGNDDHWTASQKIFQQGSPGSYYYTPVSGYENHPIVYVNYTDATHFCDWRSTVEGLPAGSYRLPTEAEWEKAAGWDPVANQHFRFGEHSDGGGYNSLDGHRANFYGSGDPFDNGTTPVGYYDGTTHGSYTTQNAQCYYGCYDMSGNVWEWCYDWYSATYYSSSPSTDPTGPTSGTYRVLRGGNWDNYPSHCRSAERDNNPPSNRVTTIGFRCAAGTP